MEHSFQLKALQRNLLPISGRNKQIKLLHYGEGLPLDPLDLESGLNCTDISWNILGE